MASEVLMPHLGTSMEEGRVLEWKKKEGEAVSKGEALIVIETEKVNYEFESPENGIVGKILVAEGTSVPVGTVLCVILDEKEALTSNS